MSQQENRAISHCTGSPMSDSPEIVRLMRLADGLPIDAAAAKSLATEEVDPLDVPECPCGWLCDTELLSGDWRCSRCDPDAKARRQRTEKALRQAAEIRYTGSRNG